MQIPSFIAGPLFMVIGLFLCIVLVTGTKAFYIFIKDRLKAPTLESQEPPRKSKNYKRKKPVTFPNNKIELNTDEIDRIYFRKSS